MLEERIVLDGVAGALDVNVLERMGGQLVIDDVLRRDAQKCRLRHAEELIQVRRVAGSDLQSAVDVGYPVRVSVHEDVDRDLPVSYTHLRAHETPEHLVCRLLLEK